MNIEEYISWGVLEAYALGDLGERECAEVERHLKAYPQLRQELQRIEEAQEQLLMGAAVQPRATLRGELMKKILMAPTQEKAVPLPVPQDRFWRLAAAAAVFLAISASYLAYDYRAKWIDVRTEYGDLLAQNQQMAQDFSRVNERIDKLEGDLAVISDPAFTRVLMAGTEAAPQSSAYIYWNRTSDEVFLKVGTMKDPPEDSQYQLWGIVDGKPVDAGVFDSDVPGLIRMKRIRGASAFAVTIEPRGGNQQPTLSTMQVIGNV